MARQIQQVSSMRPYRDWMFCNRHFIHHLSRFTFTIHQNMSIDCYHCLLVLFNSIKTPIVAFSNLRIETRLLSLLEDPIRFVEQYTMHRCCNDTHYDKTSENLTRLFYYNAYHYRCIQQCYLRPYIIYDYGCYLKIIIIYNTTTSHYFYLYVWVSLFVVKK